MKKTSLLILIFFLTSLATIAQPVPGVDIAPFGSQLVWPSDGNLITYMDRMEQAGIQWARFDLCWWSICESEQGVYNFVTNPYIPNWNTDRAISLLKERGIEPFPILCYSNPLYDNEQGPYSDAGRTAFANYCYAAALRYKDSVTYWEIWNEPNTDFFWGRTPDPEDYAKMAIVAAQRIREANPKAVIAGGATAGIDQSFLSTAFNHGLLDAVDVITIHPYRGSSPESINSEVASVRSMIASHTSRPIQIWTGEWGYNTYVHQMTEIEQAKALSRMIVNNLTQDIGLSIWFSIHAFPESSGTLNDPEWGLLDYDFTPRESFYAMQTLNQRLSAPVSYVAAPFEVEITPSSSSRRVAWFKRGNDNYYTAAVWQQRWPVQQSYSGYSATIRIKTPESATVKVYEGLKGEQLSPPISQNGEWTELEQIRIFDYPIFIDVQSPNNQAVMTY